MTTAGATAVSCDRAAGQQQQQQQNIAVRLMTTTCVSVL